MSNPKFTPGPWKVEICGEYWYLMAGDREVGVHGQSSWPDASLIAAAPEMYDALQDAVRAICMTCPAFDIGTASCGGKIGECQCNMIMELLAKARGEEGPQND